VVIGTASDTSRVSGATQGSEQLSGSLDPLRRDPSSSAVLTDLDGTLAQIVERPDRAAVPDRAKELLAAVAERYALVACITGRRALDARRIVGLDTITYSGNHGFELLRPGESEPKPDPSLDGHHEDAKRFLTENVDRAELASAGIRVEEKGAIVALHWRGAGNEGEAEALAGEIASEAEWHGLVPHRGRKVLEIRPDVSIDKGIALASLVRDEVVRAALYGGDDRTDADAFRALRQLRDEGKLKATVCVAVSSPEAPPVVIEAADVVVEGSPGFLSVLEALIG
jgi:trehalose 6-phosphate phosphatase